MRYRRTGTLLWREEWTIKASLIRPVYAALFSGGTGLSTSSCTLHQLETGLQWLNKYLSQSKWWGGGTAVQWQWQWELGLLQEPNPQIWWKALLWTIWSAAHFPPKCLQNRNLRKKYFLAAFSPLCTRDSSAVGAGKGKIHRQRELGRAGFISSGSWHGCLSSGCAGAGRTNGAGLTEGTVLHSCCVKGVGLGVREPSEHTT